MVKLLTYIDVADKLQVSVRTVRRLVKTGAIKSVKLGSSRRFHECCIDEYVKGLKDAALAEEGKDG